MGHCVLRSAWRLECAQESVQPSAWMHIELLPVTLVLLLLWSYVWATRVALVYEVWTIWLLWSSYIIWTSECPSVCAPAGGRRVWKLALGSATGWAVQG